MKNDSGARSVFISYATADQERAFEICRHLEALGHTCWIAPRDIRSGHDYGEEIIRGIERSRCLVLVLSSAANESIYVKREVERAVAKAKTVFPVRVEDVLPSPALELHLASLHYLDAWKGALSDHITALARHLSGEDGGVVPPMSRAAVTPVWWRRREVLAGIGAVALGLLVWSLWPSPHVPAPYPFVMPDDTGYVTPGVATTMQNQRQQEQLSGCDKYIDGPIVRCTGVTGTRVQVESPQGGKIIVPKGSGSNSSDMMEFTFLPWLGPGTQIRVEAANGKLSEPQPLPSFSNMTAAVSIPSRQSDAPPLVYVQGEDQQQQPTGWYVFLAPIDTSDVEWSTDSAGFIRAARSTGSAGSTWNAGPFWIRAATSDTVDLKIRWRIGRDSWSEPVNYRVDTQAAKLASVWPLQDLSESIVCYQRQQAESLPDHVRCRTNRRGVLLGDLFEELSWGIRTDQMHPVEDFEFESWAAAAFEIEPPTAEELQRDCTVYDTLNEQNMDTFYELNRCLQDNQIAKDSQARKVMSDEIVRKMTIEREGRGFSGPWQAATCSTNRSHFFLAIAPLREDVFFRAKPKGSEGVLTARIPVVSLNSWTCQ